MRKLLLGCLHDEEEENVAIRCDFAVRVWVGKFVSPRARSLQAKQHRVSPLHYTRTADARGE